jgi:two-component system, cell cycle sensor histidine kinase and response regulator CckA
MASFLASADRTVNKAGVRARRESSSRRSVGEAAAIALVLAGTIVALVPGGIRYGAETLAAIGAAAGALLWLWTLKRRRRSHVQNEIELSVSTERLRFAQEIARVGTWDTDLVTGTAIWSESLRNIWGIDRTTPASLESFIALLHPDDRARARELVEPAERLGGDFEYEYRLGEEPDMRWFLCRGRIILGDDGTPIRSLGVAMDITDRKRADEERASLETQLRQAQKLQAIGRLAGSVAHDFNNLLLAIRGYGELAQIGLKRGSDVSAEVREIVGVADRAAELTGQLLAFSRKQMLRPEVLELDDVVGGMQMLLRMLVGERVELDIVPAGRPVCANVDRGQLEQVIANLALNARDAMPEGGRLTIEVGTADLDEHGLAATTAPYAVLSVSDTGCGMDADTSAQIFEPFFTTKDDGTGLGLATVHGIVTQSGGSISLHSKIAQGTTFKIYLPLVAVAQTTGAVEASHAEGGSGETILLVEDDAQVRAIVGSMLEERGYRVLKAASAETALRLCDPTNESVDLILSDVVVGSANGREITERALALQPGACVLHMSGYADHVIGGRGAPEPGAAFIEKPFSSEELARRVRDVLENRTAA